MNYLDSLNAEQKKAVLAIDGPVLIVAGAGAGKTKTITHRILHLISEGIRPENILAITFTNKAAKEMRDRVMALLDSSASIRVKSALGPQQASKPVICTFHSLGVKMIKENAEFLKLARYFNIFDKADSKKALKNALISLGVDPKEYLDKIGHIISREKGRGIGVSEYLKDGAFDFTSELVKNAWLKYEEVLKKEHALDFDDLLLKTLVLLGNKKILEKYQNRFLYIHVDEYQDTNKVQNDIVLLLTGKHRNICVVGDTDQNIYSWRGAEMKNMLHFEKAFPETQTFFLEQNYRSTGNILSVANEIIEKNNFRIPKKLFTKKEAGQKISLFTARSEVDEAHFIAMKSKEFIQGGVLSDDIAVLYRANFQSRVLEDAFLSHGIPYQLLGTKFFERREVKDIISLVKTSLNEGNISDFTRIINIPPRGIGKVTLQKIISGKENGLNESLKIKINNFRKMLADFRNILKKEKPSKALKYIIEKSGMENFYKTGLEEDTDRLENIMELVTLATKYDAYKNEEGIENFLTDVALASDQDSLNTEKTGVKLMTVHSSKGLEFDYVFISGLEDDLFPHKKMYERKKSGEEGEEERRLFYVAITRAGEKLLLTHANTRTIFGRVEINSRSEFIDDIPEKYLEHESYSSNHSLTPLINIDF